MKRLGYSRAFFYFYGEACKLSRFLQAQAVRAGMSVRATLLNSVLRIQNPVFSLPGFVY
jgi:hypothetical protein